MTRSDEVGYADLDRGIVGSVWDAGWDDPDGAAPASNGPGSDGGQASDRLGSDRPSDRPSGRREGQGFWSGLEDDQPPPGRWYAPKTPRGKVILLLTVIVVLVVTLVACCIGLAGLASLRTIDSSGMI
jgi:hypothetical protein